MDETQGTPVDTSAAPGSDEGLSPTLDTETPSDLGSESVGGTEAIDATKYQEAVEKVALLEKRVSHNSRTAQELKAAQAEIQQYKQRFETWRKHQVDPDEIDRAIAAASGGQPQSSQQPTAKPLTVEEIDQRIAAREVLREWRSEKKAWFKENPEFNTKPVNRFFDNAAFEIAEAERMEFGSVISSADQVFNKALKEWHALHGAIEKRVKTNMTQTREKVNSQGITESKHVKANVDRGDTTEDKPETNQAWVARMEAQKARMRAGR